MNLVSYNPTPQELAAALSPQEFELLIRAYVRPRMARLPPNDTSIFLFLNAEYGKSELRSAEWSIGVSSDMQTKGEIFDLCIDEHLRRRNFAQTNRLLLLEATPEPELLPAAEAPTTILDGNNTF